MDEVILSPGEKLFEVKEKKIRKVSIVDKTQHRNSIIQVDDPIDETDEINLEMNKD